MQDDGVDESGHPSHLIGQDEPSLYQGRGKGEASQPSKLVACKNLKA